MATTKPMKVHLFKVEAANKEVFLDACHKVEDLPFKERSRSVGGSDMKMDDEHADKRGRLYFMDFSKSERMGPGKATLDKKTQAIGLKPHEDFSFLSAVLYDKTTEYILVEYNHRGAKATHIAKYIRQVSGENFEFVPCLKTEVRELLAGKETADLITYKIPLARDGIAQTRTVVAATDFVRQTGISGVGAIHITLKKGQEGMSGFTPHIQEILDSDVKGSGDFRSPDGEMDTIDFLKGARIELEVGELVYDEHTRMYPFEKRRGILRDAYQKWVNCGIIG